MLRVAVFPKRAGEVPGLGRERELRLPLGRHGLPVEPLRQHACIVKMAEPLLKPLELLRRIRRPIPQLSRHLGGISQTTDLRPQAVKLLGIEAIPEDLMCGEQLAAYPTHDFAETKLDGRGLRGPSREDHPQIAPETRTLLIQQPLGHPGPPPATRGPEPSAKQHDLRGR